MLQSRKPVSWVAGVALAVVAGVTGCSNDSGSDTEEKPAAGSAAPAESKKGEEKENEKGEEKKKDGPAATQPTATRQSTAGAAVAAWVRAIITDQPGQACMVMGEQADGSSPAQVGSPELCNGETPESQKMQDSLGKFHESFTPKPPPGDPTVEVAQAPVNDGKAVVSADRITVDGQSLDKIILSNSTGVEPGQIDVRFESAEIDGAWYVTNFEFNLG